MTEMIVPALILALVGAFAGILAGLLGVGGGIVLVPAFFYLFSAAGYGSDDLMQICLATSLATIVVTSARSVMAHNRKGAVDWQILKDWALGIMIGAVFGVLTVAQLRTHTLQIIFGVLVMVIALYMLLGKSSWRLAETMPQGPVKYVLSWLTGFISVLLGIGGGSIGVPLIIAGPGVATGECTGPVSLLDLHATVLDLAGAEAIAGTDSVRRPMEKMNRFTA